MKRNYNNLYPSVSEVLDVLCKKGLEFYFKYNTPKFLKAESEKNLEIGTMLHDIMAKHIEKVKITIETKYPSEIKTALQSFMLFKKENPEIKLKKAEIPLTSEKYKYNGTLDCLGRIKEEIIFDWKSGKCDVGKKKEKEKPPIYDDHIWQVSAYVMAYNEVMKTNVKQAGIVVIAKDCISYNYLLISENVINECFEKVFLPCLSICNYQQKNK